MEEFDQDRIMTEFTAFKKAIRKNPENKAVALQLITAAVNGVEWPHSIGNVRGLALPALLGKDAASFLTTYITEGEPPIALDFDQDTRGFLEACHGLFRSAFKRASEFSRHPLAVGGLNISTNPGIPSVTIRIHRNDGEYMDVDGEPDCVVNMIRSFLTALSISERTYGVTIDRESLLEVRS